MKIFKGLKNWQIAEIGIHLLIWGIYFSSINVAWTESWIKVSSDTRLIRPIPTVVFPLFFYFNAFYLIPKFLKKRLWFQYAFVTSVLVLLLEFIRILMYMSVNQSELPIMDSLLVEFNSNDNLIFGKLSPLYTSLLVSLAYRFTRDWILNNDLIDKLKSEKLQMELNVLKAQINPHFLFNNLNALDDLIDRDAKKAKLYLNKLSNMYRYTLTSMDHDVVALSEEWNFIDDYIYLISERYGGAYSFIKKLEISDIHKYLIPPTSLQLLIENAVKHNHGDIKNPLVITITVTNEEISVSHEKRLKRVVLESTKKGLKNIEERFRLLSEKSIDINDSVYEFSVKLPLIQNIRIS